MPAEYDCCECGIHVVNVTADAAPEPPLCGVCLHVPGWQVDPRLVDFFGDRTGREASTSLKHLLDKPPHESEPPPPGPH